MSQSVGMAYHAIREGIFAGRLKPGEHLVAAGLAVRIGASRTPVREAIRRLAAEGLVDVIPNRGAFVARFDPEDVRQMYDLRVQLEGFAAERAATTASLAQLATLRTLAHQFAAMIAESRLDYAAITRVNGEFHHAVMEASGNRRLLGLAPTLFDIPLITSTFRRYSRADLERSAAQHLELVLAIQSRDRDWARSVMTSHIRCALHSLESEGGQPVAVENDA